jgi:hypothetical protein
MSALVRAFFGAVVAFASTCAVSAEPSISGIWLIEKPQPEAKTVNGKAIPLRPEAAALYAKRKKAVASGNLADDPVDQCLPHGVPRLLTANRPIHILQKPKQITVLHEVNHQARLVYLDEPLPTGDDAPDITFNGHSVGRWSGNALVVETIAMNDLTWLDDVGLPHSEALRVVERYELASPDRLRVTVTITDPETFTAPWDMQLTFKKRSDLRLQEHACAEKLWQPPKRS